MRRFTMPYINVNKHQKFIDVNKHQKFIEAQKSKYQKDLEVLREKAYAEERRLIEENDSIWQDIESEMNAD